MTTPLSKGIYSIPEAVRLTGVSLGRVRRWLFGYRSSQKGGRNVNHSPVWNSDYKPLEGRYALSFYDMIELKFVNAFLQAGVSWKVLRRARVKAEELFNTEHPFCTGRFATDGITIIEKASDETNVGSMYDFLKDQKLFKEITQHFIKQLDFSDDGYIQRWWPCGKEGLVVIDPEKNFGRPTLACFGVTTDILAESFKSLGSIEDVADWYEIPENDVKAAVDFENRNAA